MAHHHLSSQKRFVFGLQCEKGMRTRTHSLPFWRLSNGNCVHANGNVSPLSRRGVYPGQKGGKHFIPPHVNDARICHRSSWRGGSFSDAGVARKIQFNARAENCRLRAHERHQKLRQWMEFMDYGAWLFCFLSPVALVFITLWWWRRFGRKRNENLFSPF